MRVIRKLGVFLLLVATAAVLAGLFGALHDQLSYTVSPEYYTRFKFEQFAFAGVGAMPPRLGAAVVGVLATWWVGLIAGLGVGAAGLVHREPAEMARATLRAFGVVAVVALAAGLAGLAAGWFGFGPDEQAAYIDWWCPSGLVSPRQFFAVGMMHNVSYLGGAVGVLVAVVLQFRAARVARRRARAEAVVAGSAG
jgi:hypothetical protein